MASALATRGEKVLVFDLDEPIPTDHAVDFVRGDVRQEGDLAKLHLDRDDVVYHLAARQLRGPVPYRNRDEWFADVNVSGTRRVLEAMSAGSTHRIVFFSTDMTYGKPDHVPVHPTDRQRPLGPYGRSKVEAERLLVQARREFGLHASIFRPRLIAGSGRLGVLTKLFRLIRAGLPIPLIGAGKNRYQLVAVEDCVAAALAAVDAHCPLGPFNLGSDDPPIVKDLLGELIRRAGSKSILLPIPALVLQPALWLLDRAGMTLLYPEQFTVANIDYVLSTESVTECLGWKPLKNDTDIIFEAYTEFLRS
ncbi:NAD(P)-dependent oxidoreductase [Bradyrhizobium sp. C-145]|uniref:NAD-dependent epimerase/dehydratase family protein n=1 Tax=Bradyrhizobium sp. C-145 TaxID=574727 RepID=UPI00201B60F5|nr:NAD(P)-dependent oxidoreductase [Bradyrhizobium sp. C-145]UQR61349.1 NAD(P)-dependent oxidoreductase [Bradyrhizobium sp. C-145]